MRWRAAKAGHWHYGEGVVRATCRAMAEPPKELRAI